MVFPILRAVSRISACSTNIAFGHAIIRRPGEKARINAQVRSVADRLADRPRCWSGLPKALSRRSTANASRLARGPWSGAPGFFLMDEPLSNLDAKLRIEGAQLSRQDASRDRRHDGLRDATINQKRIDDGRYDRRDERRRLSSKAASPLVVYNQPANTFVRRAS